MDSAQIPLPFPQEEESVRTFVAEAAACPVRLTVTRNSSCLLSYRKDGNLANLRMHVIFLHAAPDVLREIGAFIRDGRRKTPRIGEFVRQNRHLIPVKRKREEAIAPEGRHHNLSEIFQAVNHEYFGGLIRATITWGRTARRRWVKRRTLGCFDPGTNTIRINPVLDRKTVPRYFVAFIVYHEMLHAAVGVRKTGSRRSVHPKEFRTRERAFRDYDRAVRWEKENRL